MQQSRQSILGFPYEPLSLGGTGMVPASVSDAPFLCAAPAALGGARQQCTWLGETRPPGTGVRLPFKPPVSLVLKIAGSNLPRERGTNWKALSLWGRGAENAYEGSCVTPTNLSPRCHF